MSNAVVQTGAAAPSFSLPASTGKTINSADIFGKKIAIVYFYPKADTPGCTKEACGFRDKKADYDQARIEVFGISPDPVKDVTAFSQKFDLNFPLLADADHSVCDKYGVWGEKSFMGKTSMGAKRTTFVVGKDGKVAHVFENVKADGHEKEVLAWVKENLSNS
jgi:peroxiredoxin Q/BCP